MLGFYLEGSEPLAVGLRDLQHGLSLFSYFTEHPLRNERWGCVRCADWHAEYMARHSQDFVLSRVNLPKSC